MGMPDEYLGRMEYLKTEPPLKRLFELRGVTYVDHL
jgi:hypothetical protein